MSRIENFKGMSTWKKAAAGLALSLISIFVLTNLAVLFLVDARTPENEGRFNGNPLLIFFWSDSEMGPAEPVGTPIASPLAFTPLMNAPVRAMRRDISNAGAFASTPEASPSAHPVPRFTGPWAAEFSERYARATTDFEREILADGVITAEEYQQAIDRFFACIEAADIDQLEAEAVPHPDQPTLVMYLYTYPDGIDWELLDELTFECSQGTTYNIEVLYSATSLYPNHEDPEPWVYFCLIEQSVIPASTTYEAFIWSLETIFELNPEWTGDGDPPLIPVFMPDDPVFTRCLVNPLHIGLED